MPWLAAILWVVAGGRGLAGEDPAPDFDLSFQAPEWIDAPASTTVTFDAAVILRSRSVPGSDGTGAQGWAVSVVARGGRITGGGTDDTAGDVPPAGYFKEGFSLTELTAGEGNEGIISVVALSFFDPAMLPADGQAQLLRFDVACEVPAAGEACAEVVLEFVDGLSGSAAPIRNAITFRGQQRRDDGSAQDADADREESLTVRACVTTSFWRGDCTVDSRLDIADAIFSLNYLFLGGRRPSCLAACDADGDRSVNITDAIYVLSYLFLGGRAPPPPFPACGTASDAAPLGCARFDC